MSLLEVNNISYKYKKSDMVFKNISMSFEKGQVYAILGKSGAGKTTLLSLLAGLDCCMDGTIIYNGNNLCDINRDRYRAQNIGIVFQQFNLLHRFSAVDNVMMALEVSRFKIDNKKKYVKNLLNQLGIDEKKCRRKVIELSGGEQQRVAIARAIAHKPDVILADEPTGSLDEINQSGIIDILVNLAKEEDKCIIISTHSSEVSKSADNIFTI